MVAIDFPIRSTQRMLGIETVWDYWYRLNHGDVMRDPLEGKDEPLVGPMVVRVRRNSSGDVLTRDIYPASQKIPSE